MSIYHAFVKTAHGIKCYEVCADTLEHAQEEAYCYGPVTLIYKTCKCGGVK